MKNQNIKECVGITT